MENKNMHLKEFSKELEKAAKQTDNDRLKQLTAKDMKQLIELFWHVLSVVIGQGYRVTMYGIGSFFRKAVCRVGFSKPSKTNEKRTENKIMYHDRLRVEFSPTLRKKSDIELTEDEYIIKKAVQDQKKKK
jgi:nucleoid DNA-binding protein